MSKLVSLISSKTSMSRFIYILILSMLFASCSHKQTRVLLVTSEGDIIVKLYNETPIHRDNFKKLAKTHALDSTLFHRVIKDFMIQGGDPSSKGAEQGVLLGEDSVGEDLPAEFRYPEIFHKRGSLAAAREGDDVNPERKSSGSQFYIVWGKSSHLNGKYTVFGEVESGLNVVEAIQNVATDSNDRPIEDVVLYEMRVVK